MCDVVAIDWHYVDVIIEVNVNRYYVCMYNIHEITPTHSCDEHHHFMGGVNKVITT